MTLQKNIYQFNYVLVKTCITIITISKTIQKIQIIKCENILRMRSQIMELSNCQTWPATTFNVAPEGILNKLKSSGIFLLC